MATWKTGKVHWFDEKSGVGMISNEGESTLYFVHYSAIKSDEKHKTLKKGNTVKYQLYENLYSARIDKVVECE